MYLLQSIIHKKYQQQSLKEAFKRHTLLNTISTIVNMNILIKYQKPGCFETCYFQLNSIIPPIFLADGTKIIFPGQIEPLCTKIQRMSEIDANPYLMRLVIHSIPYHIPNDDKYIETSYGRLELVVKCKFKDADMQRNDMKESVSPFIRSAYIDKAITTHFFPVTYNIKSPLSDEVVEYTKGEEFHISSKSIVIALFYPYEVRHRLLVRDMYTVDFNKESDIRIEFFNGDIELRNSYLVGSNEIYKTNNITRKYDILEEMIIPNYEKHKQKYWDKFNRVHLIDDDEMTIGEINDADSLDEDDKKLEAEWTKVEDIKDEIKVDMPLPLHIDDEDVDGIMYVSPKEVLNRIEGLRE